MAIKKKKAETKSNDDDKVFALIGTILPIIGYIIVVLANKKSSYVMHYAKQGLGLGIAWIIAMVVVTIVFFIPFVGWVLGYLIELGLIILWLIGIVYALSGEKKNIPIAEVITKAIFPK